MCNLLIHVKLEEVERRLLSSGGTYASLLFLSASPPRPTQQSGRVPWKGSREVPVTDHCSVTPDCHTPRSLGEMG